MIKRKILFVLSICMMLCLVGCKGDVVASTTTDNGKINVYKSGTIYKYEYIIYDTKKDKEIVIEDGRVDSLSELEEKYNVSFSYTD